MKLKKLYSANKAGILAAIISILFVSCASTSKGAGIPGKHTAEIKNIYNEYYNIGNAYFELEKFDKAASYYELAMGNKENYWTVYYQLAKCYVYNSKYNEALPLYETLLKRDPDNNSLKTSIAYIYAMNGNVDKAIEMYKALIEESPENNEYLENLIAVLLLNENLEEVKEPFELLQKNFPDSENIPKFQKEIDAITKKQQPEDQTAVDNSTENKDETEKQEQVSTEVSE